MNRDPFAALLNAAADWISRHVAPDPSSVSIRIPRNPTVPIKVTAVVTHGANAAETELAYSFNGEAAQTVTVKADTPKVVLSEDAPTGTLTVVPTSVNAIGQRDPNPPTRVFTIPAAPGSSDVDVQIEVA